MPSLFNKTKDLVMKIDNFIDLTGQTSLHFKEGVKLYIEDNMEEFEERLEIINRTENKADSLREDIKGRLYVQTLIPEARGDVLGILENMDVVIDSIKATTLNFSIEQPDIPESIKPEFLRLVSPVVKSVEALASAARAYFYDIYAVKDHINKVEFYEREADRLAEKLKRDIFAMKIDLSRKIHLSSFARHIDNLADKAEEVADRVAIAAIKRTV
ncbi:MAG: DUF47 family protein [bacterium]|nr:DUF47 family protein [bacterium]